MGAVHAVKKGTGITGEKDLAILSAQLRNNVGLFSCNDWEVFGDQPAQLSPTISTRVVPANAEYGKFFRKDKKDHYINTPLFYEAWKLLKADGRWAAMSWTVKVDAPTVFMPDHLRTILATKRDDSTGVYFQNCKEVLEGFFGNLEVVSAEGFKRFLEQMDTSYTSGCWRQESSPPTRSMASSSGKTSRITTSTRPCFTKPGNCSRLTAGGRPCLGQ